MTTGSNKLGKNEPWEKGLGVGLGFMRGWVLCVVGKFTVGQFYCHFCYGTELNEL